MLEHSESPGENVGPTRRDTLALGGMAAIAALVAGLAPGWAGAASTATDRRPFEILFGLYPQFDMLDLAGPTEVFIGLPNTKVRFASPQGGPVKSFFGVDLAPTERLADVDRVDMICIPGGGSHAAMMTPEVQKELTRICESARYVTSVCNGSLILAAAGILKGRRSACHWASRNVLKQYGAIPDASRVVRDGRFISGGGVTAGIDFALTVAADLSGPVEAQTMQLMMEYNPAPPFNSGSPDVAPPEVLALVESRVPGARAGLFRTP